MERKELRFRLAGKVEDLEGGSEDMTHSHYFAASIQHGVGRERQNGGNEDAGRWSQFEIRVDERHPWRRGSGGGR